ncbi:hypothetical protein AB7009_09870 [Citrobacter werkmanii]
MAGNNENIKQLVARLKDIHQRTGMNFPAWMMDEKRSGDHELRKVRISTLRNEN